VQGKAGAEISESDFISMSQRVLIIEDEPAQRRILEEMVKRFGFEAISAEDGHRAMELLAGAQGATINLAILDLMMPGMGGLEFLERLETFAVPVLGYGTNAFPGFYLTESGYDVEHRVDSVEEITDIWRNRFELKTDDRAIVVANPVVNQMDLALHNQILDSGLKAAEENHITGKAVTPFLLEYFHTQSKGESLRVNIDIIKANSHLAALIAISLNK